MAEPLDPTEIVLAVGLAPPMVYEKARELGLAVRFGFVGGGGAGAMTVAVNVVVPVPPL